MRRDRSPIGLWAADYFVPLGAGIELTRACNLRCRHCGSGSGRRAEGELTVGELRACLAELAGLGCREVCFLGGEPLLRPNFAEIVGAATDLGLPVVLITNGWLVDEGMARRLARLDGLSRVGVSLDGASASVHDSIRGRQGSWERALGAVARLNERGVRTGVITTVMRRNLGELGAMGELLAGRVAAWQLQIADTSGCRFSDDEALSPDEYALVAAFIAEQRRSRALKELPVAGSHDIGYFSEKIRNYGIEPQSLFQGCPGGLTSVGITSFGGVKACLSLPDRLIEGDLRAASFEAIWRDPSVFARNRAFHSGQLEPPCRSCDQGDRCRAGCWAMALSSTGSAHANRHCLRATERADDEAR